jgi:hypothetical protein
MTVVLEEALIAYLKATAGIMALISTRTYGMTIPQDSTLPCLVVQRISTPRILTHDTIGATGDLTSPRFQFDAWAETQSSTKAINDALRTALNGKTGSTGAGETTVTIRAALANEEAPTYEPEAELYRTRSEYIIWIEEA